MQVKYLVYMIILSMCVFFYCVMECLKHYSVAFAATWRDKLANLRKSAHEH